MVSIVMSSDRELLGAIKSSRSTPTDTSMEATLASCASKNTSGASVEGGGSSVANGALSRGPDATCPGVPQGDPSSGVPSEKDNNAIEENIPKDIHAAGT